jgi:hypothetical protein
MTRERQREDTDREEEDMEDRTMISHLDDARVVMLRDTLHDENPFDSRDVSHVRGCGACAAELEDARVRGSVISDALAALDSPVDVAAAKAAVRARLDDRRPRAASPVRELRRSIPIGRAAAILLVTAGAAAALPWSPISPWRSAPTTPTSLPTTTSQSAAPEGTASAASVTVDVTGRIEFVVRSASPGSALEVVWRDDTAASVAAPEGSSFALGAGRVEVDASAGAIRIEAPRRADLAVTVNGRTFLQRSAAGLTVVEPAAEVTDEGVRFLVRDP